MIDTIIVSGGNIQKDFALPFIKKEIEKKQDILLIAADRGLDFLLEAGVLPTVAIGDFDSLSMSGKEYLERAGKTEIIRLKPEKDDSDTQSALMYAAGKGAKNIAIFGATGTRIDHLMANLGLLLLGEKRKLHVEIFDAYNRISLAGNGEILEREKQFGNYVSFFSIGGDVTGLTLEGFKYPLQEYHLKMEDCGLTVSNEIVEERAKITFSSGKLLMIMSRDKGLELDEMN